jgi:hypothetical protein
MKILSLFLTLLIAGSLNAQVKTGGGSSADIDATIVVLMNKLKENDFKCPSQGQRLSKDKDIVQIYLKLSLLKNTEPKTEACEEASLYLGCVNDKSVRKIARKLKELSKGSNHIATTYKIPQSEVDKMILFFSTLGETVGEENAYDGEDL